MSESATDPCVSPAAFQPDAPAVWTASEGQVGNLGYYAICFAFCWLLFRFWRCARAALTRIESRWLVEGAVGAMADLLVHGFIDNSYFLVDLAFVFWLCLALVTVRTTDARIDST